MQFARVPVAAKADVGNGKCPMITDFYNRVDQSSRSFKLKVGYNVERFYETKYGQSLDSLSLCKPLLVSNGNLDPTKFLAGTDNPTGVDTKLKKNFLMCCSLDMYADEPLLSLVETVDHVRDIKAITNDTSVLALGNGSLQLCRVDASGENLSVEDPVLIHVDENNEPALVSQVAVSRFNPAKLASCAPDKHLTTLDISSGLNTSSVTRRVDMADSIASVAWDTHNDHILHAIWGRDEPSSLLLLDDRADYSRGSPAFVYHSGRQYMYAMAQYSEHCVLLGFEGGELRNIDLRMQNETTAISHDPFVPAIGSIDFSPAGNVFTVSGLSDFSIWHVGPQGDAEVVGHSAHTMNSRQNGNGYAMNALFLSAETIFSTDTFGNVATYTSDVR